MRIVHTCLRYPPASGGVETYVQQIVEGTRDIDNMRDVRVLTSKLRTHGPLSLLNPEELLDDPPYVQRIHHLATPGISYPRLQALRYYLGHHQPDVIHGYSFWYQPADIAARFAQQHRIPFIFHPLYYTNEVRRKLIWRLYKKLYGIHTFAAADVVVVISPYEQSLLAHEGFPLKRCVLIPPGIDTGAYTRSRSNPYQFDPTHPVLLAVSRLAPGKGLDELIRVMPLVQREHQTVQLVIIGEDFGARRSLMALATSLDLTATVHFWGKVTQEKLIAAYQHATLFIHPSHYEAFGIAVAEAEACRTPVIARNSTALPFVAPHQQVGLLYSQPSDLVQAILTLLSRPTLRRQYGEAGLRHIQHNFSLGTTIKKMTNLYDELSQSS
ncbi:MAG: glycosyltransferase family 4 protein [Candidatus Andersenbacteria bacterium]